MVLDGYVKLKNGVIKQSKKINGDFKYDTNYIKTYEDFKELGKYMSYLRLGYITGHVDFKNKSILDIGYGNGDFLNIANDAGFKCYGCDVTEYPLKNDITIIKYEEIFNKYFDIVTFFDSLEHFDEIDFVKNLNCEYVVISLPNCHYFNDEWFFNWKHRKPDEHLYHFNKESLINFMNEMGYDNISISNFEDIIRKPIDENSNILSGIFKKRK